MYLAEFQYLCLLDRKANLVSLLDANVTQACYRDTRSGAGSRFRDYGRLNSMVILKLSLQRLTIMREPHFGGDCQELALRADWRGSDHLSGTDKLLAMNNGVHSN